MKNSYTELLRTLANFLQLKTDIIFVGFSEECDHFYNNIARSKVPTAYLVYPGSCEDGKIIKLNVNEIINNVSQSLDYANKNAFVVFTFINTTIFHDPFHKGIVDTIDWLVDKDFRPVLITDTPKQFVNRSGLDENDFICISHGGSTLAAYDQVMDLINTQLLANKDAQESMAQINTRLGNVGAIKGKPLIFSQPQVSFEALVAFGLLLFEMYSIFKKCQRRAKYKVS